MNNKKAFVGIFRFHLWPWKVFNSGNSLVQSSADWSSRWFDNLIIFLENFIKEKSSTVLPLFLKLGFTYANKLQIPLSSWFCGRFPTCLSNYPSASSWLVRYQATTISPPICGASLFSTLLSSSFLAWTFFGSSHCFFQVVTVLLLGGFAR